MALPRSKYSEPRHTPGREFSLDGKEYVGWYVKTYQEKYYTGKTLGNRSKEIFPINYEEPVEESFAEQKIEPNAYERDKGSFTRYFIQKRSNNKIVEVQKGRYMNFTNKSLYVKATLDWKIKGPAENQNIKGYVYFGAAHVNEVNTKALENTIKGISNFIKDYSEFVI